MFKQIEKKKLFLKGFSSAVDFMEHFLPTLKIFKNTYSARIRKLGLCCLSHSNIGHSQKVSDHGFLIIG
jgi:hypothetical protein